MVVEQLTPQQKHLLAQIQAYQQQLQILVYQRQQLELQKKEIEAAIKELEKEKEEYVYKAIGPALIRKKRTDVIEDLKKALEKLDSRILLLKSQEKKLNEKINELSKKLKM